MAERYSNISRPENAFQALKERLDFARHDPEQIFKRKIRTERRLGRVPILMPMLHVEKSLLYQAPARDSEGFVLNRLGGERFNAAGGEVPEVYTPPDSLMVNAYRQATNVAFYEWLPQYLESLTVNYNRHEAYGLTVGAGRDLEALAFTAIHSDEDARRQAKLLSDAMTHPVKTLMRNAVAADELMNRFVQGAMPLTPGNVRLLSQHLLAMRDLAQEQADILHASVVARSYVNDGLPDQAHHDAGDLLRPSGYIRDVLAKADIDSPREAQVLFSFVSALITEGAIPIRQEQVYIPQEEIFITSNQAIQLSHKVANILTRHNIALNRNAEGQPLIEGLPTGAMVSLTAGNNGNMVASPLDARQLVALGRDIRTALMTTVAKETDRLLDFADTHYEDIQSAMLRDQGALRHYADQVHETFANSLKRQKSEFQPVTEDNAAVPMPGILHRQSSEMRLSDLPQQVTKHGRELAKFVFRPEARHEMLKIFSRELPIYILNFPRGMVDTALLGFTKRDHQHPKWDRIPLTTENFQEHGLGLLVTPESLRSNLFYLTVYPLVSSIGSQSLLEMSRYNRHLIREASHELSDTLLAAIGSAAEADPVLQQRLSHINSHSPVMAALTADPEFEEIAASLARPADERNSDDWQRMARYLDLLNTQLLKDSSYLFTTYQHPDESFPQSIRRVLSEPIMTLSDATLALGFVNTMTSLNEEYITYLEYLAPGTVLLDHKALKGLAETVNAHIDASGFTVVHAEGKNGEAPRLYKKEGNARRPASAAEIVQLANTVAEQFRHVVKPENLDHALSGERQQSYYRHLENLLYKDASFAKAQAPSAPATGKEAEEKPYAASLSEPWKTAGRLPEANSNPVADAIKFALRPESRHQMNKLFWRYFLADVMYYPVQISENYLWKHTIDFKSPGVMGKIGDFFGSNNVKNANWRLFSMAPLFAYGGVALWEFGTHLLTKRHKALQGVERSNVLIEQTLQSAFRVHPELESDLAATANINIRLWALQAGHDYDAIPRVLATPKEERTEKDTATLDHFMVKLGRQATEHSIKTLFQSGQGQRADIASVARELMHEPAGTLPQAVRKLAFVKTLLNVNAEFAGILRYIDPEQKVLKTADIADLTDYIRKQAHAAGLSKPDAQASEETIIRFSNVIMERARGMVDFDQLEKVLDSSMAEQYRQRQADNLYSMLSL